MCVTHGHAGPKPVGCIQDYAPFPPSRFHFQAQALELVPNLTASSVDPDARSALLATAVRAGHRDVWEGVHRLYLAADAADERERTLRALAAAPGAAADPWTGAWGRRSAHR